MNSPARAPAAGSSYRSPLRRVSRKQPCPICGKPDLCEVSDDGAVHCCRIESSIPCTGRLGGWWHNLPDRGRAPIPLAPPPPRPTPAPARADSATLDAVYRALLAACPLSDDDRASLLARTLPAGDLGDFGTLAQTCPVIGTLLEQWSRELLLTVPGICGTQDGGLALTLRAGLLVAVRSLDGRIAGLSVRQVDRDGKKRYIWLSSSNADGPGSGSPAHVECPVGAPSHTLWVTEGAIKARIAAARLGRLTIGLSSHTSQDAGLETLARLADEGADCVVIAFDEDAKPDTAALVAGSRRKFAAAALAVGLAVRYARWDGSLGKGIDDLLVNGHQPRLERVTAAILEDQPDSAVDGPGTNGRQLTIAEQAARYRILRNVLWARDRSDQEEAQRAGSAVQKLTLMLAYEFAGYPGSAPTAEAKQISVAALATCAGTSPQTCTGALKSLATTGLIHHQVNPPNLADGRYTTAVRIAPIRPLGFNEKLPEPERNKVERERAAQRRHCKDCGSELVLVEPVRMERITCTSCGAVHIDEPPTERKFQRSGPRYEARERDHARYAAEEAEAEAPDNHPANCKVVAAQLQTAEPSIQSRHGTRLGHHHSAGIDPFRDGDADRLANCRVVATCRGPSPPAAQSQAPPGDPWLDDAVATAF